MRHTQVRDVHHTTGTCLTFTCSIGRAPSSHTHGTWPPPTGDTHAGSPAASQHGLGDVPCILQDMPASTSAGQGVLQEEPASSLLSKQAVSGGPSCQVEGCDRDLCLLSAYHQKCRICDLHIKAPSFSRAGLLQRFCQRCGRCHELGAFEGTRRSCRAQLAKHNARSAPYMPHFSPS